MTDSNQAYDLWQAAKYNAKLLSISFQAPHTPAFAHLAHERDNGRLGNVQLVTGKIGQAA